MTETSNEWKKSPPPLRKMEVCGRSECVNRLHCFKTNMRIKTNRLSHKSYRNGGCRDCNANPVDWERIDKKDPNDVKYTIRSLKREYIRNVFWKKEIDHEVKQEAIRKGITQLRQDAEKILRKSVGLPSNQIFRDGTQTPMDGNIINHAQHATATCCRRCIEEWYAIDRNLPLTDSDIKYFIELIIVYAKKKIPYLTLNGKSEDTSQISIHRQETRGT